MAAFKFFSTRSLPDGKGVILTLKELNLKTSRAFHIKLNFQEIFNQPDEGAERFLKKWHFWDTHSRLEPVIEAAYTIKHHWDGVF